MFRKKPPQLSSSDELAQLYAYARDANAANLAFEKSGEVEAALKGCKSLHTLLLYKLDLLEKSSQILQLNSGSETLSQIRQIRDENVKHLIRVQLRVDEVKRANSNHGFACDSGNHSGSSFTSNAKYNSASNHSGKPLQSSMRHDSRPPASNSQRPLRRSLRPAHNSLLSSSSITSTNNHSNSYSSKHALGAATLAVHSMENLPRSSHTKRSGYDRTLTFPPPENDHHNWQDPFHDFDDDPFAEETHRKHSSPKTKAARDPASEPDLIDVNDDNEYAAIYYSSLDPSLDHEEVAAIQKLSLNNKPRPPSPTKPQKPGLGMARKSKLTPRLSADSRLAISNPLQPLASLPNGPSPPLHPSSPPLKAAYVYKKPTPINVTSLMKNASKQKTRPSPKLIASSPDTTSSTVPSRQQSTPKLTHSKSATKASTSMNYNYTRATSLKTSPTKASARNTTAPSPTKDDAAKSEEEEIIALIRGIDPNAARQILTDIVVKGDEVHWDDVVGLEAAKNGLKEAVVYPFLRPDLFKGLREPARGMLLFGPPGTGKTMLARAVATESRSTFFSISLSSLTSKYLGESEKLVKALFLLARKLAPLIVFIDEIDSLLSSRAEGEQDSSRRIKNEFLVQWSELLSAAAGRDTSEDALRVLILGATNLPWSIDEAARRRFMRRQYIPLPEPDTRRAQIARLLQHQSHTLDEEDLDELTELTDGFSGSDVTALAKDSAMGPLRLLGDLLLLTSTENIRAINLQDFKSSLLYIRPSVSQEGIKEYETWAEKFGSSGV